MHVVVTKQAACLEVEDNGANFSAAIVAAKKKKKDCPADHTGDFYDAS